MKQKTNTNALEAGLKAINQGDLINAQRQFSEILKKDPENSRVIYLLGCIYIQNGLIDKAIVLIEKALDLDKDNVIYLLKYANVLKKKGSLELAVKTLKKVISLQQENHEAWFKLGNLYKHLGQNQNSINCLRKALSIKPDLTVASANLGGILNEVEEVDEAIRILAKVVKKEPGNEKYRNNYGNALIKKFRFKEAKIQFESALEMNKDSEESNFNYANVLKYDGEDEKAIEHYKLAIKINPLFSEAYVRLGIALEEKGDIDESIFNYKRALEIDPNKTEVLLRLSSAYQYQGLIDKSKDVLNRVLLKNEKCITALYAKTLLGRANIEESQKIKILKLDIEGLDSIAEKINLCFAKANVLHMDKRYKEGAKWLKQGNEQKLKIYGSDYNRIIEAGNNIRQLSYELRTVSDENDSYFDSLFIVGMPRSGSTLIESIISHNEDVETLGETNILGESLSKWVNQKKLAKSNNLIDIYRQVRAKKYKKGRIYSDKNLYNFINTGIICTQIPEGKIIHCIRNPLDNILSIYRSNFSSGNLYSSSLVEISLLYIHQMNLMKEYKSNYNKSIYTLDYDKLVLDPDREIKNLISWMGWDWKEIYKLPHLSNRTISTASKVQVRSPINRNSIGEWKNYKDLLEPAIKILKENDFLGRKYELELESMKNI